MDVFSLLVRYSCAILALDCVTARAVFIDLQQINRENTAEVPDSGPYR